MNESIQRVLIISIVLLTSLIALNAFFINHTHLQKLIKSFEFESSDNIRTKKEDSEESIPSARITRLILANHIINQIEAKDTLSLLEVAENQVEVEGRTSTIYLRGKTVDVRSLDISQELDNRVYRVLYKLNDNFIEEVRIEER